MMRFTPLILLFLPFGALGDEVVEFGETEHEVRSVRVLEAAELNAVINAGDQAGECWTGEAVLIALHLAGETVQSQRKTVTVECHGERHEHPDKGVILVTVTEHGYLDDSIGGQRHRFWLERDRSGAWLVKRALWAQLCRRMDQVYFSAENCP